MVLKVVFLLVVAGIVVVNETDIFLSTLFFEAGTGVWDEIQAKNWADVAVRRELFTWGGSAASWSRES